MRGDHVVDHLSELAPAALTGRLAEIVDAVEAGITVQDADLRLVFANRAAAVLSGWSDAAAMLRAPVSETLDQFELIDLDGEPLPLASLPGRRALAGEAPEPIVVGFRIRATGEERWSRVQARSIELDDGSRYAVTTFHDLTDNVRAERASLASERRYREIVEALPVVAWFADTSGVLVASNARWLDYTGATAASETLDGAARIHPDDRAAFEARWEASRTAGEPLEATVRLRRHDDAFRWHQVRIVPSRADGGQLQGWIGTATDIDDERRASQALIDSERLFRDLTNSAPMLVWMSSAGGGRVFFNSGWLSFTGRSLDEVTGDGWLESVHPDDVERVREAAASLSAPGDRFEVEYRLRRHDGTFRWILDIGTTREGPDGAVVGHVGSAVDIEERKRAADMARLMADAALRLDEVRSVDQMVDAAAAVAIPALADWCVIDLVTTDGSLRRATAVAGDPETQAVVDRIREFPTGSDARRAAAKAVRNRKAVLLEDLDDDAGLARATAGSAGLAEVIAATGARSAIVQPLIARGVTIGAIFFVVGPDRSYTASELPITGELANRLALAISNGQIHAAEQEARRSAEAATERVSGLQRVTRRLAEASTRSAVAEVVVREGRAAIGASGAVVMVVRDRELVVVADDGYEEHTVETLRRIRLDSPLPLAEAARSGEPIWLEEVKAAPTDDALVREVLDASPNASGCAVPLKAGGRTIGSLGVSFARPTRFDADTKALIGAYADLCAQALTRVDLAAIREQLVADLEAERARLEALLQQLPEGLMIAEAPSGRILMANERLEEILGIPRSELHHIAGGEAYQGFDVDGRQLRPEDWPLSRAVKGETTEYAELRLIRPDGSTIWVAKRARPVRDRDGRVVAGVATIIDISEARQARENRQFLSMASEALSASLDYEATVQRVAELAVPHIADWCAVDILDESGQPQRLAVAHPDASKIELLRRLQEEYPADPEAEHGLWHVLRTGQADMMSEIPPEVVEAVARDERHLEALRALRLHSYICVPIMDRSEVLGALTFIAAESGRTFGPDDLAVAENIAGRAAAAITNARSYREAVRYKRILDATLDAVVMFDPLTLRISYANQGASDQLGYPVDDLIGAEATLLVEELDAIGIRGLVAPLVRGELEARTATIAFRHQDGRSLPVEVLLQHVALPGEPARIVAIARDIADRLEAQVNLRRLAESEHARAAELNAVIRAMGDGIFVCSSDGSITLSNPAAEALFPNAIERTYGDVLAQLDDPTGIAPRLGVPGGPVELRALGEEERWIELSAYPVVHEGEDPVEGVETILLLRDVTTARQSQAIRDTFIGVLSHELRTPVTTIFAGAKVLARDADQLPESTRRDIFSDIVVESERLHRLVEDVIAMTRFGEDEGDVGTEPVLLQRVLPVVVRSEEPRWPGVTFVVDMPSGLPTAVADPTYVEQVLRNLLSNAAKYGGPGTTVKVAVAASRDDSEVVVSVTDDGPGFPVEEADRIFDLFFRSARTSTAAAGAGIGLFVCARLIKAMGGRIWAEPGTDGGATFTFTLRVMTEED